jgi:hypothetical protein
VTILAPHLSRGARSPHGTTSIEGFFRRWPRPRQEPRLRCQRQRRQNRRQRQLRRRCMADNVPWCTCAEVRELCNSGVKLPRLQRRHRRPWQSRRCMPVGRCQSARPLHNRRHYRHCCSFLMCLSCCCLQRIASDRQIRRARRLRGRRPSASRRWGGESCWLHAWPDLEDATVGL